MIVQIKTGKLQGQITAPPSKSYAHRYLIASSLSKNECTISNIDFSDDITATLNCIYAYGKSHNRDFENRAVTFASNENKNFDPTFDCKESGSTLRMFMPVALTKYRETTFIGSDRLIERGIDIYKNLFKNIIFNINKYSIKTSGTISAGIYELPGNVSSQYISGLLFACPILKDDSTIIITTNIESINYILLTIDVLKKFGIDIETNIDLCKEASPQDKKVIFKIKGNQCYTSNNFSIEGDYSNAAFIDAFNYFENGIIINDLNPNSLQSDKVYKDYFNILNKDFSEIDIGNCIDLGPILITFSALKHGARFINTERLRLKESDRGNAIATELRKCGADINVLDNEIIVNKKKLIAPIAHLDSHNDHRIAMSLSLLSTQFDIEIDGAECINKSYPNYFKDLKKLGAVISEKL